MEGNVHNKNGKGNELDKGGLLQIPDSVQKHSKRSLSYRGHDMRTCSTVSMESGHARHLSMVEQCRLRSDWLGRDRLTRSRAKVEASEAERVVKYSGRMIPGHGKL